jgi:hypothetical protein
VLGHSSSSIVSRLKSKRLYLIGCGAAKVRKSALATLRANILGNDGISEPLAGLSVTNLENSPDLGTNKNNQTTSRASREYQLALTVAASASLLPKLKRW